MPRSAGKEIRLAKLVVRPLMSSGQCQMRSYENRPEEMNSQKYLKHTVSPVLQCGHN